MKKFAHKSAVAVSLIFFAAVFAVAQPQQQPPPCDLTARSSALLLDLRAGMSPAEAQAAIGRDLKIKIKKAGERTFFQNFIKRRAPASLNAARAIYLRFFDRKLYQIEIFYEPRFDLNTLAEVTDRLAADLNFAAANWTIENNRARIVCGEISLVADLILNPRVELTDETIRRAVEEKRKKDEK